MTPAGRENRAASLTSGSTTQHPGPSGKDKENGGPQDRVHDIVRAGTRPPVTVRAHRIDRVQDFHPACQREHGQPGNRRLQAFPEHCGSQKKDRHSRVDVQRIPGEIGELHDQQFDGLKRRYFHMRGLRFE